MGIQKKSTSALFSLFYFFLRGGIFSRNIFLYNKFLMFLSQSVSEKFLNVYHYLEMVSNFTVKIRIIRSWP